MVEKIKQFSLTILLIEIIFSSDLYAQSHYCPIKVG